MKDHSAIYIKEINRIPLMSVEEEKEVAALAFKGNKAAQDKLVKANLRFVVKQAHLFEGQGLDFDDLVSEGNGGLMYAATKFDPSKNTKFITYAVWWINHYMRKAVYEKGQSVKVTVGRKDVLADVRCKFTSLDKKLDGEKSEGTVLGDIIEDDRYLSSIEQVIRKGLREDIEMVLGKLPASERDVIRMRFGLDDGKSKSLQAVGDRLGYSKERIRQIENKTLVKVRQYFENLGYADYVA